MDFVKSFGSKVKAFFTGLWGKLIAVAVAAAAVYEYVVGFAW